MQITTTDTTVQIKYGKDTFTHPVNTIVYIVNDQLDSVTFTRNNERIATCPLTQISVNGDQLTADNFDDLLGNLFS